MAKLPRPEEYGRKLAEQRRKANSVPEMLASLIKSMQGVHSTLEGAVKSLADQAALDRKDAVTQLKDAVEGVVNSAPPDLVLERLTQLSNALEDLSKQVALQAERVVNAQTPGQPADYGSIEAKLAAIEAQMTKAQSIEVSREVIEAPPAGYTLVITDRDDEGDIVGVDVQVTRH